MQNKQTNALDNGTTDPSEGEIDCLFKETVNQARTNRARLTFWIVLILVPLGSIRDYFNTPEHFADFALRRFICTVVTAFLYKFFFSPSNRSLSHHAAPLLAAWVIFLNSTTVLTSGSFDNERYFGSVFVLLVGGLVAYLSPRVMALLTALTVFLYIVPGLCLFENIDYTAMYTNTYMLLFAGILGTASSHIEHQLRHKEFSTAHLLRVRTGQLEKTSQELGLTIDKLHQADAAKTQFFANITHELKTPLTLILLPLDGILNSEKSGLGADAAKKLSVLRRQANQLLTLVNDILTLSRLDHDSLPSQVRHVDLNHFARDLVSGYQPLADEHSVKLLFTGSPTQVVIEIDPRHLQTIFNNLIINAFKYTGAKDTLDVHIRSRADQCIIVVRDTGLGVAKADLANIFDRFVQAENPKTKRGGGFGIGLSLTRELVKRYGGDIQVESSPREGTKFTVRFARSEGVGDQTTIKNWDAIETTRGVLAGKSSNSQNATVPRHPAHERILIVEDHDELRNYLRDELAHHYTPQVASSADVALDIILKEQPDLVLTDIMMPGISGLELVQKIRSTFSMSELPCILLSAGKETDTIQEALASGANDYIQKPFNLATLLARIEVQLRLRSLSQDLSRERVASAMGLLASGLAHELRNPLNAVVNGLPALRDSLQSQKPDETEKLIDILELSTHKMSSLIDELVRFGTDGLSLSVWDPNAALHSAWKYACDESNAPNATFQLDFLGSIQAFGSKVDESLQHLLRNALTAAGPKGQVHLRTREHMGGVSIEVSDDGPGIAPNVVKRIFDPFFTTHADAQAAGLGLHMVQWVTRLHGGHIQVESNVGRGSTFRIWLPRAPKRELKTVPFALRNGGI